MADERQDRERQTERLAPNVKEMAAETAMDRLEDRHSREIDSLEENVKDKADKTLRDRQRERLAE